MNRLDNSEEISMEPDDLKDFIDDVGRVVSGGEDQYVVTKLWSLADALLPVVNGMTEKA